MLMRWRRAKREERRVKGLKALAGAGDPDCVVLFRVSCFVFRLSVIGCGLRSALWRENDEGFLK